MARKELTYDVVFQSNTSSMDKGMNTTYRECLQWIKAWNGSNYSYFEDYKGGWVTIVCWETGETVYEEEVR